MVYTLRIDGHAVDETDLGAASPWRFYSPNGAEGGRVAFNTLDAQILWATTNADVTLNSLPGVPRARAAPAPIIPAQIQAK